MGLGENIFIDYEYLWISIHSHEYIFTQTHKQWRLDQAWAYYAQDWTYFSFWKFLTIYPIIPTTSPHYIPSIMHRKTDRHFTMTHEWHHTYSPERVNARQVAIDLLLRDSSDDFGKHERFRRLLVVAELLELCSSDSSSAPQVQQMTTARRWIYRFPPCLHVYTWTIPVLFWLFLYYARWQEVPIILKIMPA